MRGTLWSSKRDRRKDHLENQVVSLLDDALSHLDDSIANLERVRDRALAIKKDSEGRPGDEDPDAGTTGGIDK